MVPAGRQALRAHEAPGPQPLTSSAGAAIPLESLDPDAVSPLVDKLVERGKRGLLKMEQACFASTEPSTIWTRVSDLVDGALGAHPVAVVHYSVSIGAVLGLELEDGRHIAVKVFAPWHDRAFLEASDRVRRRLLADGYPAPRPLAEIRTLGAAHVWLEEWLPTEPPAPPSEVVGPMAHHLADLVDRCAGVEADPALTRSWQTFERPVGIWRNPPRPDADPGGDVPGSEWVREIADHGRSIAEAAPGRRVVGHIDWRPDNVRLTATGDLEAVFDWDSVQLTHHVHVLAGACSGLEPKDMSRFLSTYETAAGARLSPAERRAVAGRVIWSRAILARFELVRQLPASECRVVPRLRTDVGVYLEAATG